MDLQTLVLLQKAVRDAHVDHIGPQGPPGPEGQKGEDGKTPKKGVDYWTEEDKQEIIQAVLEALTQS